MPSERDRAARRYLAAEAVSALSESPELLEYVGRRRHALNAEVLSAEDPREAAFRLREIDEFARFLEGKAREAERLKSRLEEKGIALSGATAPQ